MEKATTTRGSAPPTTFVQTDANTFRELVQRLTGSFDGNSPPGENEETAPSPPKPAGTKRPTAKLHERRQYMRPKLEIAKPAFHFRAGQTVQSPSQVADTVLTPQTGFPASPAVLSPSTPGFITSPLNTPSGTFSRLSLFDEEKVEPSSGLSNEAEERAIREKGFYLHPSPVSRPGNAQPELLDLFPLTPKTQDS